jgi:threonine dehydrogenase-like Zn-dependent dehydrogenase
LKQIVLKEPGQFIRQDAAEPVRKPDEALLKINSVGVCGSDFHAFNGTHPVYTYPRILGHEISATIVEIPPNDAGLKTGDRCAVEPYLACGHCRACAKNRPNCCENLKLLGVHVDGGMQEYLPVPVKQLHRSETLSLDQLALVETLGIGANAVDRSGLSAGEDVLVVGAGPIGLAVIQFALAAGASVRVLEKNEQRREFVRELVSEVI